MVQYLTKLTLLHLKMQISICRSLLQHGVVIGDSFYDSENSPLNNWSDDVDPAIMAGDQWVHPTNDIGWNTSENKELIESNTPPQGVPFMHSTKDVSYSKD
jgi:hypothetical protein